MPSNPDKPRPWRNTHNLYAADEAERKRMTSEIAALRAEIARLTTELRFARDTIEQYRSGTDGYR